MSAPGQAATVAAGAAVDRIPTVDFAPFLGGDRAAQDAVVAALGDCFERYGFVSLVGHGLPPGVVAEAFAAAEEFFARPEAEKRLVADKRNNRGFIPMFDSVLPGQKPSGHEAFSIGHLDRPDDPELRALPFHAETPWPDLPGFRERIEPCYRAMFALGEAVLRAAARHLGAPEDFFAEMSRQTYSNMRVIHYPPQDAVAETSEFGVSAHTDRGLITLLIQDMNGGLSVQTPEGSWLPVVPDPEAVVINVGRLLRHWTNGRYAAALHRVVNTSGRERYSIPLFVHPSFHTAIDPRSLVREEPAAPEFAPIVAGETVYAGFQQDRPSWKAALAEPVAAA
ncbi:isopenicillin N synthase family dioxygenase [Roseomonas sp. BN140053]|uniref:isopenicillin N synthase family dioxygenase n=1 Tax=Roseomonas sp. BN140053 TaxID=3391898 RepID=UPI0039E863C8